jgi:hypothetical protein
MKMWDSLDSHAKSLVLSLVITGILMSAVGVLLIWKSLSG